MKTSLVIFLIMLLFGVSFSDNGRQGCSEKSSGSVQNENDKIELASEQKPCEKEQPENDEHRFIIRDSVRLSESLLKSWQEQDSVHIFIADDLSLIAVIERFNINVNGTISIRARFVDYPHGYMIMSSTGGITSGTVNIPGKNIDYRIKTDTENKMIYLEEFIDKDIIEIDTVLIPPEKP